MSDTSIEKEVPRLASLEVSPGEIDFDPEVTEYTVQVEADVTKLLVRAKTAEDGQTYTVKGNDNLAPGSNDLTITVSSDQEQTVYHLTVIVGSEQEQTDTVTSGEVGWSSFLQHATTGRNRYISLGICACAVLAVIFWIVFAVKRIKTRQAQKARAQKRLEERKRREERTEQAHRHEEELLRQIELLRQKSKMQTAGQGDGMRVISLDDEEQDLSSQDYDVDTFENEDAEELEDFDWDEDDDWDDD